ncbi:MAG: peptidoglycan DD-metalloendopeptidase family protein [Pseudomonadota bacterium]
MIQPTDQKHGNGSPFPWRKAGLALAAILVATATVAAIHARPGADGQPKTHLDTPIEVDPASASPDTSDHSGQWQEITVRRGDTFQTLVRRHRLDHDNRLAALLDHPLARPLYQLRPGQVIRVRVDETGRPMELAYRPDLQEELRLTRTADGFDIRRLTRHFETRIAYVTGAIETSLFEDGQDAGLADAMILKLVEIFGWDIDFALDLRRGDRFSVVHEEKYWRGQKVGDGVILAAEFVSHGRVYRAIAHRNERGITEYYTPEGRSVKREYLRTPVEFSRISSGYTLNRFHPILKRWGSHRGVDYAAPSGTPVRATADGRILSIGRDGGYGNRIILKHPGAHTTLYAHLSAYAKKLRVGSHVEQGQIIAYVGTTGLSTGPHLHYEFRVDGQHVNPLKNRPPPSPLIAAADRDAFRQHAAALATRLDAIGAPRLARRDGE